MKLNWRALHAINKKRADGVIAVSYYIENFYHQQGRPSVVIPPLFDTDLLIDTIIKPKRLVVHFIYAGFPFVSGSSKVKPSGMKDRLDLIIDFFSSVAKRNINFRFDIVGITKKEYITCIPRHKNVLNNLSDRIVFHDRLSHDEIVRILQKSDFTINFRDKNRMTLAGMSTKVVESISMGVPVIMNDIGDTFNYVLDGYTGFKLSYSLEDNIDKICWICNLNRDLIEKMKEHCINSHAFFPIRFIEQFDSFLKKLRATNKER